MTNSAGVPSSRQRLATAAATCVLPQPLGPESTSQPVGLSAKPAPLRRSAGIAPGRADCCCGRACSGSSNVRRVSGPRLL